MVATQAITYGKTLVTMVETLAIWPQLREDLAIYPGPRAADGSPTWTLYDQAAHRYYRLGWLEFECLQFAQR